MKLRLISLAMLALLSFSSCKDKLTGPPTPTPAASDTIAYWTFSDNLKDETGNGHDGAISGKESFGPDRFGNANSALILDGNSSVSVANVSDINFTGDDSYTISAWVKTNVVANAGIIDKGPTDGSYPGYRLDESSTGGGNGSFWVTDAGHNPEPQVNTDKFADGNWHMITVVVTAHSTISIYLDSSIGSGGIDGYMEPEFDNIAPLFFGADPNGVNYFNGSIDDILFLNRAVDPVEVTTRFHEGGWYEHPDTVATQTHPDSGWSKGSFGSTTANIEGMCFAWVDTVYACGFNGTILRSIDGGNTWVAQNSGTTQNLYRIRFQDGNNGIAGGNNGTLLKTTNEGAIWSQLTLPSSPNVNIRDIYWGSKNAQNPQGLMIVVGGANSGGTEGVILTSTDAGNSWTVAKTTTSGALYGIDQTTATVVGNAGQIYKPADATGLTWTDESVSGAGDDLTQISFSGQNIGLTVSAEGTIYKTNNGFLWSLAWQSQASIQLRAVSMVSATEALTAGQNGVILQTLDGGLSWSQLPVGGFTGSWNDIEWPAAGVPVHKIAFIGDNGTLYWLNQ